MGLLSVKGVIYFYIFICVALLIFNLFYISRSDSVKRRQRRKERRWEKELRRLSTEDAPKWDQDKLFQKLRHIQELMAFQRAMERRYTTDPKVVHSFFLQNRRVFLRLAMEYGNKSAMEQAFFAYVIAAFHPVREGQQDPMAERLLGYLEDSTVYSRENVLNALYALGNAQAVEQAYSLMNQHSWYHDPRLLADGLSRFQGPKEALAQRLWARRGLWAECFQVGIIRFADGLPGDSFGEVFLAALAQEPLPLETRFTLVRYFNRHPIPQAKPLLLDLLKEETIGDRELAIAAAMVLSSYADSESREALKQALCSPNWYVRQNAARSLQKLGITQTEAAQIQTMGDRYATEMLDYALGHQTAGKAGEREVLMTQ